MLRHRVAQVIQKLQVCTAHSVILPNSNNTRHRSGYEKCRYEYLSCVSSAFLNLHEHEFSTLVAAAVSQGGMSQADASAGKTPGL